MGAANSTQNATDKKSLTKVIDFVATNYILTQNFTDMKNLAKLDYCNSLVIMTADVIAKKLNENDIKYLAQRIKDGVEINEMVNEKVIYLKKADVPNLDIKNETQKRRVCIGIAKHYVRIAHLFAAIVTTVNPIYTYKDKYGSTVRASLMNKQTIPKGAQTSIKKFNICTQRLNALINNQDFDVQSDQNITVKPKFCDMNYDRVRGRDKTLIEEPGIPELEKLYYDKYDDDNGGFKGMTKKMRTQVYEKDVERFYKAFTGNKGIPMGADGKPAIKKFSQIPLRDFHRSKGCTSDGVYTKPYTGSIKDKLFGDYAAHVKEMMQTAETNQDKLIGIIDDIFVISNNPTTGKKEIVISPTLTEAQLEQLVVQTRNTIIDLYIKCEDDFIKGLELFEAIVEKQIVDTSQEQIAVLEKTIQDSIADATEEPPSKTTADEEGPVQEGAIVQEKPESKESDDTEEGNLEKSDSPDLNSESASSQEEPKVEDAAIKSEASSENEKSSVQSSESPNIPALPSNESTLEKQVQELKGELKTAKSEVEEIKNERRALEIAKELQKEKDTEREKQAQATMQQFRPAYQDPSTGDIFSADTGIDNKPIKLSASSEPQLN